MIKFPADEINAELDPVLKGDSTPIAHRQRHGSGQSASVEMEKPSEQLMMWEGRKIAGTAFGWRYTQGTDVLLTAIKMAYVIYDKCHYILGFECNIFGNA